MEDGDLGLITCKKGFLILKTRINLVSRVLSIRVNCNFYPSKNGNIAPKYNQSHPLDLCEIVLHRPQWEKWMKVRPFSLIWSYLLQISFIKYMTKVDLFLWVTFTMYMTFKRVVPIERFKYLFKYVWPFREHQALKG